MSITFKDRVARLINATRSHDRRGSYEPEVHEDIEQEFVDAKADLLLYHQRFAKIVHWLAQHHYRLPECSTPNCSTCKENQEIINQCKQLLIEEEIDLCRTF